MAVTADAFADDEVAETQLVQAAQAGDRDALTRLVVIHKPWIYNIALRMLWNPAEAEDVTQDVLVKVLQRLSTFEGRSRLRTWLYRIVVNHILNLPKTGAEHAVTTFTEYGEGLDGAPNGAVPEVAGLDEALLVEEAKVGCMTGMLLCLNREQRVAYVLGSVFALQDTVCAEILEISREAFRKRLSRARHDLHAFMEGKCGLINESNPCRCARKTKAFIDRGFVDPERLKFVRPHAQRVGDVARREAARLFTRVTEDYPRLFREHPMLDPDGVLDNVRRALRGTPLEHALD